MIRITKTIVVTCFSLIIQSGFQPAAASSNDARHPPYPPEEAFLACNSAAEADPCEFTAPQREISGSCLTRRSHLVCVPTGGPPHRFAPQSELEQENAQ